MASLSDIIPSSIFYYLASKICPKDQFACGGVWPCLPMSWVCDGSYDCPDRSDEANCTTEMTSSTTQATTTTSKRPLNRCGGGYFDCDGWTCLRSSYVCDGRRDCGNDADEDGCAARGACPKGFFRCGGSGDCVRDVGTARAECDSMTTTQPTTTTTQPTTTTTQPTTAMQPTKTMRPTTTEPASRK